MEDQRSSGSASVRVRPFEIGDLRRWFESDAPVPADGRADAAPSEVVRTLFDFEFAGTTNAWIVESAGRLIGMAVVLIESDALAHLKHLWIARGVTDHPNVARALAETAIRHAWEGGCLKLVVHTALPASRLILPMHELGFEFAGARSNGGEAVVEFYRNLYERPRDR
ncbi:MAG TPA: GNAT family N-acetyltransferase [Tepidisphaeraceae bacterium]